MTINKKEIKSYDTCRAFLGIQYNTEIRDKFSQWYSEQKIGALFGFVSIH